MPTWWLGIPSSSSHTLIGSIIGVGAANAMMHGKSGTAGVDWSKATEIGQALLVSPLIGFGVAALLFLAISACRSRPRMSFRRALQERWRRTARACR